MTDWNEQRERIFLDRYSLRGEDGEPTEQSPHQMMERVAKFFARDSGEKEIFLEALEGFKFLPSGRILCGAKGPRSSTFYNCFVLGMKPQKGQGADSRQAIMETLTKMVEITARGGGVGMNWSTLRPRGSRVVGVSGVSAGSCSWMKGADALADQIRQGGSRTAALMFLLEDWHPDLLDFLDLGEAFHRANFSVGISRRFMEALERDEIWAFCFPETTHPFYNSFWDGDLTSWVRRGLPVKDFGGMRASEIWRRICSSAHRIGSPGLVFLDECRERSNTYYHDRVFGVNPCGEQPLPIDGVCNLGSLNLMAFLKPHRRHGELMIDFDSLKTTIRTAVRFLDRVIDVGAEVDPEIWRKQRQIRRIGLGTMGLADLLIAKELRYGSEESLGYLRPIFTFIRDEAYRASTDLAREFDPAPAFKRTEYLNAPFVKSLPSMIRQQISQYGIRNLSILTQAPTGTISILAGTSSGIEPIFSDDYTRRDATGSHQITDSRFEGEDLPPYLVTSKDLTIEDHIAIQATIQQLVDSSVSKTVNLPPTATEEDVSRAYKMAYIRKCKGISIYVSGSLEDVLSDGGECKKCEV